MAKALPALPLALLCACGPAGDHSGPVETYRFELAGRALAIDLPPGSRLRLQGGFVHIETRPGSRASPTLMLKYIGTAPPESHRIKVKRGFTVAAGSGGNQADLDGEMAVDGGLYRLSCFILGDDVEAEDADWCLPLARSLRVE